MAGRELAEALRRLGLTVKLSVSEFGRGADDSTWLPAVGERGWILLSKDRKIRRRKHEMQALKSAKVRAFFFGSGDMTSEQMIESFRKAFDQIARTVRKQKPPYLKRITPSGNLVKLDE